MIFCFVFVLPKKLDVQAWPILEGNKRDYPRGASVIGVLIVMHLSCIRGCLLVDFYLVIHT